MKLFVPMLLVFAAFIPSNAQTVVVQPGTPITYQGLVPGSPSVPNMTGPLPVVAPGVPDAQALPFNVASLQALFGSINVSLTNANGLPTTPTNALIVLMNLQRSIEQALPFLAAMSDSLTVPGPVPGAPPVGTPPGPIMGTPTAPLPAPGLAANANRPGALTPTGTSTTGAFASSQDASAPGVIPSAVYISTLQALGVVRSDLERMLPLLAALNGVTSSIPVSGSTVITNSPGAARGPALAPGGTVLAR